MPKPIPAADLLRIADYQDAAPFTIDLVYAQPQHPDNHFPGLYRPDAQLFVHKLLLPTLLEAARLAYARHGWTLCFLDCFRSIEAQAKMSACGFLPALVSTPGRGGHPRGMAVDVTVKGLDFGTPFDFFTDDLVQNLAARHWPHQPHIMQNRAQLDACLFDAAMANGLQLEGYAEEWWDYRLPRALFEQYAPVSEADLPPAMRLTEPLNI